MKVTQIFNPWQKSNTTTFWAEIAPCEHVVQIYDNDDSFLDTLTGYVGTGINAGECVVIITTQAHREGLELRLATCGVNVDTLLTDNRYIPLDAHEMLAKFMVNGWPDDMLFHATISEVLERAMVRSRTLRAFGEMVAVLWAQGHQGATVRLETLWNEFCMKYPFPLFCAYPKSGFTSDINKSIRHICSTHAKMVRASHKSPIHEIQYKPIV